MHHASATDRIRFREKVGFNAVTIRIYDSRIMISEFSNILIVHLVKKCANRIYI